MGDVPPFPGRPVLTLRITAMPDGLIFARADEYRGFLAANRTLTEALSTVLAVISELAEAGAVIPSLDGVKLS